MFTIQTQKQSTQAFTQTLVSQVYVRFLQAAFNGTFVTYPDVAAVLFSYPLSSASKDQIDCLWSLFDMTMALDAKAGRPPLAALYVSRVRDKRMPKKPFFDAYAKHYGTTLDEQGWEKIVKGLWESYTVESPKNGVV